MRLYTFFKLLRLNLTASKKKNEVLKLLKKFKCRKSTVYSTYYLSAFHLYNVKMKITLIS